MILLLVRAAAALDAHGAPAAPGTGATAASPLIVGEAGTPPTGGAVTVEAARQLVMGWPVDGGSPVPVLDDLVGMELGGAWGFGRVGVTASLPLWLHASGDVADFTGLYPGDLRIGVPWTVYAGKDVSLTLRGEGSAPTGANAFLLGGGWGVGVHAVLGRSAPGLTWSLGSGVALDTDAKWQAVDRTLTVPVSGQVGFSGGLFGGGLEAWLSPSLSATESRSSSSSGEALLRFGVRTPGGVAAAIGGGYAIASGVGSGGPRVMLRIGWSQPAKEAAGPAAEVVREAGPGDVVVRATDANGKPLDATVSVTGPRPVEPVRTGRDGEAVLPLGVGEWQVAVEAPGKEVQTREVVLGQDEWRPAAVDAVLPASEKGPAKLQVRVVDATGAPVPGAEVRLDDTSRGETSTGGALRLDGLDNGERHLVVTAPGFVAAEERFTLDGEAQRTVVLAAEPGTVRVVARSGDAPAPRAQVRFIGPGELRPPLPLGDDGEELVQLAPGRWTAVVTAPDLGMQEREVQVEPGSLALLMVDVRLAAKGGDATLGVRVIDPSGRPVDGAEVALDGVALGHTSSGGGIRVGGLAAGEHLLAATGALLRPAESRVTLAGDRDVDLVLGWAPGTLAVRARGPDGEPVDAAVRFQGRAEQGPQALGADGEGVYTLPAGDWKIAVSAASFGLQERAVRVEPDAVARVEIDASLLREAGNADLALTVRGPDGADLSAAAVRVDGRDAGTVGGTGAMRLTGLAPGKHQLVVDGDAVALGLWQKDLQLAEGVNTVEIKLGWADRAVRVRATGPGGPVSDGIARGFGPGATPITPLGADGQAVLGLDARAGWGVAVSSGAYGVISGPVPSSKVNPAEMELRFTPPAAGKARLLVEVAGPDGTPVAADVRAGEGKEIAMSGSILLTDLVPGPLTLTVAADGFEGAREDLVLLEGDQSRRVRLLWNPRPVRLTVADTGGKPVDAEVRFAGPGDVRPGATGNDGALDTKVLPGEWQVLVSAPAYGARSVTATIPPGAEAFPIAVTLEAARVEVTAAAVELDESIHFAFDSAMIEPDSKAVLEEIAGVLQLHPEITRVEIQGHTDDKGLDVYNLDLSQRRAEAVRAALVEAGVAAERLVAKGYGATQPIAPNTTEAGRQKNRRVQIVIVERAGG